MPQPPVLTVVATGEQVPLDGELLEVGRGKEARLKVEDPTCSRKHFSVGPVDGGYELRNLSQQNPTEVNGQPVLDARRLAHGDYILAGRSEFVFNDPANAATIVRPPALPAAGLAAPAPPHGPPPAPDAPAPASPPPDPLLGGPTMPADRVEPVPDVPGVQGERALGARTRIGRDEGLDLRLPHPHVSRVHAELVVDRHGVNVRDLRSANGTYLNGLRLTRPALLQPGDTLGIGPYRLLFTGRTLRYQTAEGNLSLVARDLSRRVKDAGGREVLILDDVSLVIEPNEFVALLGPSGSGKSTLMSALSGRVPASQGKVLVNGEDLYREFEALKRNLALVPQKDVVHGGLTVWTALRFTARLRLPPDTSPEEIDRVVARTLESLGLAERRDTRIAALSGGQIKRVSLANELIARPSLLFLDEVTSGLDEQTDREMMECFRRVADTGKTVVCITHSLTNVDRTCDLVVFLTKGGKLAFVGTPAEAVGYFEVERLGDVYDALERRPPEEWQRRFRQSPLYQTYVAARLKAHPDVPRKHDVRPRRPLQVRAQEAARQLGILTERYARLVTADRPALAFAFGQAALVALTLWVFFGDLGRHEVLPRTVNSANLLFLLATSALWFGCSNAAKEIVKEADILARERDVNLEPLSYYLSKVAVLGALGALQVLLLLFVARGPCGLEGGALAQLVVLVLALGAGMTLGLFISAASTSTDMAVTIVPMVLIPQVIFAGGIGALDGLAEWVAHVAIANFWAFEALKTTLPTELADQLDPVKQVKLLGEPASLLACLAMLVALSAACAAGACVVLYRGLARR